MDEAPTCQLHNSRDHFPSSSICHRRLSSFLDIRSYYHLSIEYDIRADLIPGLSRIRHVLSSSIVIPRRSLGNAQGCDPSITIPWCVISRLSFVNAMLTWGTVGVLLPIGFIRDRFFTRRERQTPFVQQASLFQDFVIRCVRYAFANIPATVGKVFFSKEVALPFFYFRMLRHGYLRTTIPWQEVDQVKPIKVHTAT